MNREFTFIDPGKLVDGDLELVLVGKDGADSARKLVPWYTFEMRKTGTSTRRGRIKLRIGRTRILLRYAGQVGYLVLKRYRGHRYAARSCRLLLPLARAHGLTTLWITCKPKNTASRKTLELAGGRYVETVRIPKGIKMHDMGYRFVRRYRFDLKTAPGRRRTPGSDARR